MTDTYAPGQTIYLTATATNAEQQPLADAPGTWTTTAGTITPDPTNPDQATLVNVPVGSATVTFTAADGVAATLEITVVDDTVAAVTITSSATAPTAPATGGSEQQSA